MIAIASDLLLREEISSADENRHETMWNSIENRRPRDRFSLYHLLRLFEMMNIWLGDPEAYYSGKKNLNPATQILGIRRMEHADIPNLEQLIRPETYEIFGDVDVGRIYGSSCLAIVQCNEENDIISGICLCNYSNVPSVAPEDWLAWLYTLYKVEHVTERNTMFVHFLVWDKRYTGHFFDNLLSGVFDVASHLQHVLLVLPPGIIIADVFEGQMIRVLPRCVSCKPSVQSLFMTDRHLKKPRLKIRRVVEEDNDDVVPIIDAETGLMKEFYGEYYVSEMVRYPDNSRRLIVCEDDEGMAAGVMFLNSTIDVDVLDENFELGPYNGNLEKKRPNGRELFNYASRTYVRQIFFGTPNHARLLVKVSADESMESFEDTPEQGTSAISIEDPVQKQERVEPENLVESSQMTFLKELPSISTSYYKSKMMTSALLLDSVFDIPRTPVIGVAENSESLSLEEIKLPSRPVYYGEPNAFVLEVFATQDHIKRRWSKNFVEAAFECFPDLDYCAILLPSCHPFLSFLEHFVRVPLRCNKDYPMTLYVTHRAALLGQIKLRDGKPSDRDEVQELLERVPKVKQILVDFDEATKTERKDMNCYVLQWNDTIIGVAIICTENETTYIRRRYHVEDYIAVPDIRLDAYGRILHFVMMPIFSIHLQYFFCEIMRFSGLVVLYYRLAESALSALTRTQPLTICLNAMVPVKSRLRIKYEHRGFVETDEGENEAEDFSLFMTTPRLAMMTYRIIDAKIVVVGASDCGVAFMETLAFGQTFVRFRNLTLISPNGLPFDSDCTASSARMIPFRGRYCRDYRRLVAARAWINVVYGTVVSIQRQEKYVTVMNQGNITYDYLVLTCGLQYQRPNFPDEAQGKGADDGQAPWNCLTINDDIEAATCLKKLRALTNDLKDERRIIVYGHNIDCYCALQGILEFGIKGSWITLIQPPLPQCDSHETIFFGDSEICVEVLNSTVRNDIEILVGWELIQWNLWDTAEKKIIESIVIKSKGKTRTLGCDALVIFHEKTINMKIFLAICRSGLVFDGQLVIDPDFRTNDSSIFAAGTITKYCRKFNADSWQHGYFSRIEIGERMAKILQTFVTKQHQGNETVFEPFKGKTYLDIPVFRSPKIVACTLPGGYNYLHVCKPGKAMRREVAINYGLYGQVLVTGTCKSEIGYFRIRLNSFDTIETLTCFTKKDFEMHHMIRLHGKHESLLNELKTRFEKSLVVDFYAYFREPWAMAIFCDRFECFRVENRATLLSKTAVLGHSLINDCIRAFVKAKWQTLEEKDRRMIQSKYAGSVYQQELEESLVEFLESCEEDIPVYCTPGKLRELFADIENSPLFTDI